MIEIILAFGLMALLAGSIIAVAQDILDPGPMTDSGLAGWAILGLFCVIVLVIVARALLHAWVRRIKRRPAHEQVRAEVMAQLPAHLAKVALPEPGASLWLLFTLKGPILRSKPAGSGLPGPRIELDMETQKALTTLLHGARRRVFGPVTARVLRLGESLYQLPPPSNHQIMEALARARRTT